MSAEIKHTYNGIEITYVEHENVWGFELRGRERSAESLMKAKEAIDKAPPKDKPVFKRYDAWFIDCGSGPRRVEVTSIAKAGRYDYGTPYFWVNHKEKKKSDYGSIRARARAESVYPCNPFNDALVEEYRKLEKEIEELEKQKTNITKNMEKADLSKHDEEHDTP